MAKVNDKTSIILFVDSDQDFLDKIQASLGDRFALETASTGKAVLDVVKRGRSVSLVVCNVRLPDVDGIRLLAKMEKLAPAVSRVALMDGEDFDLALKSVNQGRVLGILTKPLEGQALADMIKRGLEQHHVFLREQEVLDDTLRGSVKALLKLLEIIDPPALGRSRRVRKRALQLGRELKVAPMWQLDMAVMLSHVGCLTLPVEITRKLNNGKDLTPDEQKSFFRHPAIAAKVLSSIRRMAGVAQIILHQNGKFSDKLPLESRILKAVLDLDRQERKGLKIPEGLDVLRQRQGVYDPEVLDALSRMLGGAATDKAATDKTVASDKAPAEAPGKAPAEAVEESLAVEDLAEGMVMAADLVNKDGTVLLLKGQELTRASLVRLKMFAGELGVAGPVAVQNAPKGGGAVKAGDAVQDKDIPAE